MRVLAYRGEIFGTRGVSIRRVGRPREGRGRDELGEVKSVFEICSFLGLVGYYRGFFEDFS